MSNGWTKAEEVDKYTFPPGTYFIGNIANVIDLDIYNMWASEFKYKDGMFKQHGIPLFANFRTNRNGTFPEKHGASYKYRISMCEFGVVSESICYEVYMPRIDGILTFHDVKESLTIGIMNDHDIEILIDGKERIILDTNVRSKEDAYRIAHDDEPL